MAMSRCMAFHSTPKKNCKHQKKVLVPNREWVFTPLIDQPETRPMTTWTFTFDGITCTASTFEGSTLINFDGRIYELAFAPIDLKQAALSGRR